eukprot:TRINITY_DN3332_c0_g1_i1.p1 TRINITY_DN3332_c0_g1~~TRINITY_DN3332_c0_g1_i1.p1  ORF type:complete len:114 (+),score=12.97 TRINITY_DN3332_c0_g1_i1:566-907(+)
MRDYQIQASSLLGILPPPSSHHPLFISSMVTGGFSILAVWQILLYHYGPNGHSMDVSFMESCSKYSEYLGDGMAVQSWLSRQEQWPKLKSSLFILKTELKTPNMSALSFTMQS